MHKENERSRRDLGINFSDESSGLVKKNQDNDLNDTKLTNLDSITVSRNPSSDNDVSNKKHIHDELEKKIVRFNQTLQKYPKVSVGKDIYNFTKYEKIQTTDTTIVKYLNIGGYLLQNWVIKANDKNNIGKIQNFIRSTKTHSPSSHSGAESLPPIGSAFMYIETSSNNHGVNDFVSCERTDVTQITNITFYYTRFFNFN